MLFSLVFWLYSGTCLNIQGKQNQDINAYMMA